MHVAVENLLKHLRERRRVYVCQIERALELAGVRDIAAERDLATDEMRANGWKRGVSKRGTPIAHWDLLRLPNKRRRSRKGRDPRQEPLLDASTLEHRGFPPAYQLVYEGGRLKVA